MRLIDADALEKSAGLFEAKVLARGCGKSVLSLAKAWLFNEVEKAPTIDAVPVVHGRWKCVGQVCIDGEWYDILRCGNCDIPVDRKSRCCPNCGARMDGDGK